MKNPIYALLLKIKNSGVMSGLSSRDKYLIVLVIIGISLAAINVFTNWFPDAMRGNSVIDAKPTEFSKQEAAPVPEPVKEPDKEANIESIIFILGENRISFSNILFVGLIAPFVIALIVFAFKLIREIWYDNI